MASGRLQVMPWLFWKSGMSCGGRLKFCGKLAVAQLYADVNAFAPLKPGEAVNPAVYVPPEDWSE